MSTQRRRVLEDSGLVIPADGVYIEGLDGKAYTVDEWQGGDAANSVIVASGDVKFRIAFIQPALKKSICSDSFDPLENYMAAISGITEASADYDGAGNTAKILQMQPSTDYAAGYCNAYIFPDGKTRGYLPSFGQWNLACQNKDAVDAALTACRQVPFILAEYYWSSTFWGIDGNFSNIRRCWTRIWHPSLGLSGSNGIDGESYVRPFADIS